MDKALKLLGVLIILVGIVACYGMWPGGYGINRSFATAAKITAIS